MYLLNKKFFLGEKIFDRSKKVKKRVVLEYYEKDVNIKIRDLPRQEKKKYTYSYTSFNYLTKSNYDAV